jgi:hypothetical protein
MYILVYYFHSLQRVSKKKSSHSVINRQRMVSRSAQAVELVHGNQPRADIYEIEQYEARKAVCLAEWHTAIRVGDDSE